MTTTALATLEKRRIRDILENPETFGTVLMAILLDNYGTEFFNWEPQSVRWQLRDDFQANLPQVNQDKIWSLITAMTTNQFQTSWEIFSQTCRSLNGEEADFSTFAPNDPEDLIWGVVEVLLNDPPDKESGTEEFSPEIANYVGVILTENGIWQPPELLSFAAYAQEDPTLSAEDAFTDDPDMFAASQQNQGIRKQQLEQYVKERLSNLFSQLSQAPLINKKVRIQEIAQVLAQPPRR